MSDSLRAEIERFDPSLPVERALTPPSFWYTSPDLYDLERRAVFRDTVNRYGPCLDSNYVLPLAPDRCRVVYEPWFEPGVSDAFVESSMAQTDVTQRRSP